MSHESEEREETRDEQAHRIVFGDPDAPNEFSTERIVMRNPVEFTGLQVTQPSGEGVKVWFYAEPDPQGEAQE